MINKVKQMMNMMKTIRRINIIIKTRRCNYKTNTTKQKQQNKNNINKTTTTTTTTTPTTSLT